MSKHRKHQASQLAPTSAEPKIKPIRLSAVDIAFPVSISRLLPPMEEIPAEFKSSRNPWCRVFSTLFYSGGRIALKAGIDNGALGHLKACMGSFEPKHEHKEAGVAYLMSLWCDESMIAGLRS